MLHAFMRTKKQQAQSQTALPLHETMTRMAHPGKISSARLEMFSLFA